MLGSHIPHWLAVVLLLGISACLYIPVGIVAYIIVGLIKDRDYLLAAREIVFGVTLFVWAVLMTIALFVS